MRHFILRVLISDSVMIHDNVRHMTRILIWKFSIVGGILTPATLLKSQQQEVVLLNGPSKMDFLILMYLTSLAFSTLQTIGSVRCNILINFIKV